MYLLIFLTIFNKNKKLVFHAMIKLGPETTATKNTVLSFRKTD